MSPRCMATLLRRNGGQRIARRHLAPLRRQTTRGSSCCGWAWRFFPSWLRTASRKASRSAGATVAWYNMSNGGHVSKRNLAGESRQNGVTSNIIDGSVGPRQADARGRLSFDSVFIFLFRRTCSAARRTGMAAVRQTCAIMYICRDTRPPGIRHVIWRVRDIATGRAARPGRLKRLPRSAARLRGRMRKSKYGS